MAKLEKEIIEAYRRLIRQRYDYDVLSDRYDLPPAFTPERVEQFREYFLTHIYPSYEKRQFLNQSFEQLDRHIKNPASVLSVLLQSAGLLLRHGRRLPGILNAGIKALRSFRIATFFEQSLVQMAREQHLQPPITTTQVQALVRQLPADEIEELIEQSTALFMIMNDRKLIKNLIHLLDNLVKMLRKRPQTFSPEEIKGFEIGQSIIVEGNRLVEVLEPAERELLIKWVITIERDALREMT